MNSSLDAIKEIFIMSIDHNKYVAPYEETRWIMMSSLFFLVPSTYGYKNEQYFMSTTLMLASLFSVNYWRHPTYSWRRIADRISAKMAFVICFINGIRYSYLDPLIITEWVAFVAFVAFVYCYYMSNKYCNTNLQNKIVSCWWKYHLMFHLFSAYSQLIIIHSMIEYENRTNN